jgi:hypothetical protein
MTQGRCRADGTGAAAPHQERAVSNGTNRNPRAGLAGGGAQTKMLEPDGIEPTTSAVRLLRSILSPFRKNLLPLII